MGLHEVSLRLLLLLGTTIRHPLNFAQCLAQERAVAPSRFNSQVCFLHRMQKLVQLVIRPSFRAKTCDLSLYLSLSLSFSSSLSLYIPFVSITLSLSLFISLFLSIYCIYIYIYIVVYLSFFLSLSLSLSISLSLIYIYICIYSPLETSRNLYFAISAKKFTVELFTELLSDASIHFRGVCASTIKNDQGSVRCVQIQSPSLGSQFKFEEI